MLSVLEYLRTSDSHTHVYQYQYEVMYRKLNARQFGLKMIANVTYGYSAASFSGRMPCTELADSIVQLGRQTLERAMAIVERETVEWKGARVVYGDTDSIFVELPGYSREQAFDIGHKIAAKVTSRNPRPVKLQFEKVYHPCILVSKKRYVGYAWESKDQQTPTFDAKGIEAVRRDSCRATVNIQEQVCRILFETKDLSRVKQYIQGEFDKIQRGEINVCDFVFAKEVRLGTYSERGILPPAALVATRAMKKDPRAEPLYAERIPYMVVYGPPKARLMDMIVDPKDLIISSLHSSRKQLHLHTTYYITKQIIPALDRLLSLVGVDVAHWYRIMPKRSRPSRHQEDMLLTRLRRRWRKDRVSMENETIGLNKSKDGRRSVYRDLHHAQQRLAQTNIDYYYRPRLCMLCENAITTSGHINLSRYLCANCLKDQQRMMLNIQWRTRSAERRLSALHNVCKMCCRVSFNGSDSNTGDHCMSLDCPIMSQKSKWQTEHEILWVLSSIAAGQEIW